MSGGVRIKVPAFTHVVGSLYDALFVLQIPERFIVYANPAALELFGYEAEELLGRDTERLHVSPAHSERFHAESKRILEDKSLFETEFEMRRKDGTVFPTLHAVSAFEDDGHQYAVSIIRDLSRQKQREATIRESESRFRKIAENLREVFWITNAEHTTLEYVSPVYEEIWGRSVSELMDNPRAFLEAIHPEDRERVEQAVPGQADGDYDSQYRIVRPDGEVRWIWDRAFPIHDPQGRVEQVVGIAEDITILKQQEERLLQTQKMEAVGRLTGGIAHDFNNMLTVIIGNAELLSELVQGTTGEERELAERVLQASYRASELTSRLLTFARQRNVRRDPLNVNQLITECGGLLGRTLGEHVRMRLDLASDVWAIVADRSQLESSLINLAVNARDAMRDGGTLSIRTANVEDGTETPDRPDDLEAGDFVMIEVTDEGVGIPPELIDKIFEPFFTTKAPGQGTGMGLSMVFGYVSEADGQIDVVSEPGAGTRIRMYFPRHAEQPVPEAGIPARPAPGSGRILVVEDEELVRALLVTQLKSLGYEVLEAHDGPSALKVLSGTEEIDLMLTDVVMPGGLSGPELVVRARSSNPALKVLFSSGYGAEEEFARTGLPADSPVLRKPFRLPELAGAVSRALEG